MDFFSDEEKTVVVNGVTFSEDLTKLTRYPESKKGNFYNVPDSVESIEDGAFFGCKALTGIYIPNSVYHIGYGAFKGCDNLKNIIVEDDSKSYKSINGQLFDNKKKSLMDRVFLPDIDYVIPKGITHLTGFDYYSMEKESDCCAYLHSGKDGISVYGTVRSVIIPKKVADIPQNLFYIFDKAESFNVDEKNSSFKSIDGVLFSRDGKRLIAYPAAKQGSIYTVPDGVETIGERAFSNCTLLKSVNLPDSIRRIERYSFSESGLKQFVQPKNQKRICAGTFEFCKDLDTVELKDGLRAIDDNAFYGCSNITAIELPDSLMIIGKSAFAGCSLGSIKIGPKVQALIHDAFAFNSIESIEFGEGVGFIGKDAFEHNPIQKLEIPDNVKVIESGAFRCCEELTQVHIGTGLRYISPRAFHLCGKLSKIKIERGNPKYISFNYIILDRFTSEIPPLEKEEPAHPELEGLKPVITLLPEGLIYPNRLFTEEDGVLFVGKKLFKYPAEKKDANYTIPDWVDDIEPGAFEECRHLEEVTLSPNIRRLKERSFQNCSSIKKVVFPRGITHIGYQAFDSCDNLCQVVLPRTLEVIEEYAFSHSENLKEIELPDGLEEIGDNAFFYCTKLKSIKIPGSVRTISRNAFCRCSGLKTLIIENGVCNIEKDAFAECSSLTEVHIPESVTNFESGVFSECTKLRKVILPNTFDATEGMFTKCENLAEIAFGDGEPATKLPNWLFSRYRLDLEDL